MGPFEQLAKRRQGVLFFFTASLTVAGWGLALMALGIVFGWAEPVYAGLAIAAPFAMVCALTVASPQFPQWGERTRETIRRHRR